MRKPRLINSMFISKMNELLALGGVYGQMKVDMQSEAVSYSVGLLYKIYKKLRNINPNHPESIKIHWKILADSGYLHIEHVADFDGFRISMFLTAWSCWLMDYSYMYCIC